jgi:hypothetical protein
MGFGGGFKGGSGKVGTDQEVSGTIHISEEQASTPDAPTDSGGILYVKSGDPTKVYYRGKGGSETDLTATGGGGGGGGIALDPAGSENQLLTRHANANTASAEANLTFDGSSNVLTVTGQVTASVGLSGAAGQFGSISLASADLSTTLGTKLESSDLSGYFQTTNLTASVKDVISDSGTSVPVTNLSGEISLDNLPSTLTASVLSGTTAVTGAAGQFGTATVGGATVIFNTVTGAAPTNGSILRVFDGGGMTDNAYLIMHRDAADEPGLQARSPSAAATNLQNHITDLGTGGGLLSVSASVGVSASAGQFGTITGAGSAITSIDADNISAGTLNNSRLPTTIDRTIIKASDGFFHGVSSSDHQIHIKSTSTASLFLEADSDNSGEGDNAYIKLSQDGGAVVGYMGFTSASLDPGGAAYTDVTDNALLIGTTDDHSELQFGLSSSVIMTLRNTGRVGIGTNNPQHTFDVPDMGGMILAYSQITGSRDGTGKEVLIGLRSTNYRTTTNWAVQHETSSPTDGSQLKLTFTMPASGRTEISVPSGLITTQPHTDDATGASYDGTWWGPDTSDVEAALTASGYSGNDIDWTSRQAAILVSLSTNSSSYEPAGPRSEFEHLVDWRGNNNLSYNRRFAVPSWVMTGAAGSLHTVYLAFCNDGNASTRIMTLAYGGTGSADADAPGFGPIVMKAVSLPSTS